MESVTTLLEYSNVSATKVCRLIAYMHVVLWHLLWHWLRGGKPKNCASAGNRTRIYCLEGNNANLYTTDARYLVEEAPQSVVKDDSSANIPAVMITDTRYINPE